MGRQFDKGSYKLFECLVMRTLLCLYKIMKIVIQMVTDLSICQHKAVSKVFMYLFIWVLTSLSTLNRSYHER